MLSRFKPGLAQLVVLAFICGLAALAVGLEWHARFGADVAAVDAGRAQLKSLVEKEHRHFLADGAFAPTLETLDFRTPAGQPWSYRLVASRLRDTPVVMIEAVSDNRVLFVESDGQVYLSTLKPVPMKESAPAVD